MPKITVGVIHKTLKRKCVFGDANHKGDVLYIIMNSEKVERAFASFLAADFQKYFAPSEDEITRFLQRAPKNTLSKLPKHDKISVVCASMFKEIYMKNRDSIINGFDDTVDSLSTSHTLSKNERDGLRLMMAVLLDEHDITYAFAMHLKDSVRIIGTKLGYFPRSGVNAYGIHYDGPEFERWETKHAVMHMGLLYKMCGDILSND